MSFGSGTEGFSRVSAFSVKDLFSLSGLRGSRISLPAQRLMTFISTGIGLPEVISTKFPRTLLVSGDALHSYSDLDKLGEFGELGLLGQTDQLC